MAARRNAIDGAPGNTRPPPRRWGWAEVAGGVLLLLMAVNLLSALPRKGLTNDELAHIPAGSAALPPGDPRFNDEHPPLPKLLPALPPPALPPRLPPPPAGPWDDPSV